MTTCETAYNVATLRWWIRIGMTGTALTAVLVDYTAIGGWTTAVINVKINVKMVTTKNTKDGFKTIKMTKANHMMDKTIMTTKTGVNVEDTVVVGGTSACHSAEDSVAVNLEARMAIIPKDKQ